jgi:hypothetical protein
LKYQTVLFPNGMFSGLYGASMSHNDIGILNMSSLTTYMENSLYPDHVMVEGLLPALYGDSIFMHLNYATILAKYDLVGNAETDFLICKLNRRMLGIRQSIELMYGQLFNLFHLLQTKWQIKILRDATLAYRLGVISFFILNCYTCLNGSPCNSMFDSFAPTIQEYIPLDEDIVHYVDNDAIIYNFYQIVKLFITNKFLYLLVIFINNGL